MRRNPGTFVTGGSPGTVVSNTASYNEIGTFLLQLVDASYANVDTADSSAAEPEIRTRLNGGRAFLCRIISPCSGAGITPACATTAPACSGSLPTETNFTYMNQGFATFAVSIEGRAAAETKTENYHTLAFPAGRSRETCSGSRGFRQRNDLGPARRTDGILGERPPGVSGCDLPPMPPPASRTIRQAPIAVCNSG